QRTMITPMRLAVTQLDLPTEPREAIALAVLEAGGRPDLVWSMHAGAGENPTVYTTYGLEVPASGGSERLVAALIDAGAPVTGKAGGAALIRAAANGHVDVLRVLVDAGAPLDHKDEMGETALGAAVTAANREAIELLESAGAREW
ncbi:MAG: ankyrin repeat domain-containing protein, partial [Thermoanaerobaculia bacterium]|nr:ankyrin repeat domain-containing protein [Thermoanaerobaculia bacterium]